MQEKYIKDFSNNGFVLVKNLINYSLLDDLKRESYESLSKSKSGTWKANRVYNDYPYFLFNGPNIFGVEYPFNYNLNKKIFGLISKIKFRELLLKISGWKNYKTSLSRLHYNPPFFNYSNHWHRDFGDYSLNSCIQAVFYLEDESGFRIVSKEKNTELKKYNISPNKHIAEDREFALLGKDMFEEIEAKRGDVLFFFSSLLHQANCLGKRLHYHIRFEESQETEIVDEFNLVKEMRPEYEIKKEDLQQYYKYNDSLKNEFFRIKFFMKYFLPHPRIFFKNMTKKKNDKNTIFHSTIWQRFDY